MVTWLVVDLSVLVVVVQSGEFLLQQIDITSEPPFGGPGEHAVNIKQTQSVAVGSVVGRAVVQRWSFVAV